jgi:hypothetical protein
MLCTFALVLPQGWCCLLPVQAASVVAAPQKAETPRPSCPHCSHVTPPAPQDASTTEQTGAPDAAATHSSHPQPAQPAPCECSERQSTPQRASSDWTPDLALPAFVLVVDVVGADLASHVTGATEFHFSQPSLQLLHCVWLC